MKCNKCKVNDADIFLGYLKSNRNSAICLCMACSVSAGITHHILKDDMSKSDYNEEEHLSVDYDLKCPECLTDIKDFLLTGQTGCSQCYQVFQKEIDSFFRSEPLFRDTIPTVRNLSLELQNAIVEENYEYAATLRDRLKVLSSGETNEFVEN